ncbi:putative 2-oxoglutarate-dependent dioxygenase [Diplonema papillatum]|nr:putative 2-oxoglutarate-dependent dioxygenase [Diplonema papillatum]
MSAVAKGAGRALQRRRSSARAWRQLPVVDVECYVQDVAGESARHDLAAAELRAAFRNEGFVLLKGHGMPAADMARVIEAGAEFFRLAPEEKDAYALRNYRGYQRPGLNTTNRTRDYHEALDFFREPDGTMDGPLALSSNPYPAHPRDFEKVMRAYVEHLLRVGKAVMACISRGLGVDPSVIDAWMVDPCWVLRVIHTPSVSLQAEIIAREEALHGRGQAWGYGCGAHTDYGFLTFLLTDGTPDALEVQALDGEWMPIHDIPAEHFIINIGDMLSHLTGGLYRATPHRVRATAKSRLSVPFFFEPSFNAVVTPLPIGPDAGSREIAARGAGIRYGDHLMAKLASNFHP